MSRVERRFAVSAEPGPAEFAGKRTRLYLLWDDPRHSMLRWRRALEGATMFATEARARDVAASLPGHYLARVEDVTVYAPSAVK
jgi:hypothetical protein